MEPNQPGSSNPDPGQTAQSTNQGTTATQPGTATRSTVGVAGTTGGDAPAPKAQSEIGPTTFGEGGRVIQHGADDPVTRDAYKLGHPADGIAQQRAHAATAPGNTATGTGTAGPQITGTGTVAQPAAGSATQPGTQPGNQPATQTGPHQAGTEATTRRVQMLRDEGGYSGGQTVDVPADRAQQLIDSGAARAV
jgi:hypothetical protein